MVYCLLLIEIEPEFLDILKNMFMLEKGSSRRDEEDAVRGRDAWTLHSAVVAF